MRLSFTPVPLLSALFLLCSLLVWAPKAPALEEFTIRDIRVEGLDRMTAGTVFNYLPLTVGDRFTDERSRQAVRELFKTGLFRDVRLEREGDILVVVIEERESIAAIEFVGNKDLTTDNLLAALADIGFAKGEVFNEVKLDKVTQELRRQYYAQGKYGVSVESEVIPVARKLVNIKVTVVEGKAARIKDINIVGNDSYDEDELLDQFTLTTPGWFTWFNKRDQYSRQKLSGDIESLQSFYQDNGYVNFRVVSTQVSVTPDKSDVYITINISEGDRFRVADVKLRGELIVDEEELFKSVETRKGDIFSRKKVTSTSDQLSERLGVEGYAFANVNAIPDIDNENQTVSITYFVDPGQRTYVRRISFSGNTTTRDEVLRREMRQLEGGWISTAAVERSKVRLQRLGFFEQVNVETPAVAGSSDQVDVNYSVKEMPSGSLSLGLGFSQSQGIIFNTAIAQNNFLGSGKSVNFAFNNSDVNRTFRLGYINPYYTVDGVSRGFDARYQETNAGNANITRFDSKVISFGATFGVPISEYNYINFGAAVEHNQLDVGGGVAQRVLDFIAREGDEYNVLRLTGSFAYDTRNSAVFPTDGVLHRIRTELATPGGDLNYYKLDYETRWFTALSKDYTLALKGRVGYGGAFGQTTELPFFENFYAGGPRSVRGFRENTLGPKDEFNRATGGDLITTANAEVILPMPFLKDIRSVRVTGFVDAGNVYGVNEDFQFDEFRYSTGVSGIWLSPFGILSVSVAAPLNDQSNDQTQPFQFSFGTSF